MIGIGIGVPFIMSPTNVAVYDSFNRPDNNTTIGKSDTGQTYFGNGAWGTSGGKACLFTTSSNVYQHIDTLHSDVYAEVTFSQLGSGMRLMFRYVSNDNNLFVQATPIGYTLYKRVASTATILSEYATIKTNGDKIAIRCKGANIQMIINDVIVANVVESANQNGKIHGLSAFNGQIDWRWDNLKVEAI